MKTAIGLMSGTSLDGIDVALVRTDGEERVERGAFMSVAYEPAFRKRLAGALETAKAIVRRGDRPGDLEEIERDLTMRHASALGRFLEREGIGRDAVDIVGFHGQTVLHRPDTALTVQLGDGAMLARESGIPVVYDMRANDMRHGGQGAPLAPVYHRALAAGLDPKLGGYPVVFVNIGGISNITYCGADGTLIAFDSGPGNTLIDQWVERHAGIPFDQGGTIAGEGTVLSSLAERYLASDFFTAQKRRALDRNDFAPPDDGEADLEDGARTLAYVTAAAILKAADHLPERPALWIVCGGGRLNATVMRDMAELAGECVPVIAAEDAGFDGDAVEAEAWAYLAVRALGGHALTVPSTTGVREPVAGGIVVRPDGAILQDEEAVSGGRDRTNRD